MRLWSRKLASAQIILIGFAGVILGGSLLLMLPIAQVEGQVTPFLEALFTATSATCVSMCGEELHLTPIEYKLLCLLSHNIGKVLTHKYITQSVWGSSWENDIVSLRVYMATLRKKLGQDTQAPEYIQTHIGIGYRMLKIE